MSNLFATYKKLFKRLWHFIFNAPEEWEKIADEHPTRRQCVTNIFLPMLAIELFIAVCITLWEASHFEGERLAFKAISIVFCSLGGYYSVNYLTYRWLENRYPSTYLRDDCEKIIAYGFMILMAVDSLVLVTGNMIIWYALYAGIAYEYMFAFKSVFDSPEDDRITLNLIFTSLTIFIPTAIRVMFKLILPNAPM